MGFIPLETLEELVRHKAETGVSIYLPTHRTGINVKQNSIRFKNLLRQAEKYLQDEGFKESEIKKILKSGQDILEDHNFWQHQLEGLAVFLSADNFYQFKVPLALEEFCAVSHFFYMKPLIPLVGDPDRYYILALDLNNSTLYEASRFSIRKLEMESTPTSMEEALQYDEFERYLQFHTRAPAGASGRQAMFHGQGVGTDDAQRKKYILQFFHQLDRGVVKQLTGEEAPLVLIGVDYLTSIYKEANDYPHLMQESIYKNPHSLREHHLQELGWQVVEPLMKQQQKEVVEKFNHLKSDGKASSSVEEIIPAAHQGRIETLFVDRYKNAWGIFDPMKQQAVFHEEKKFGDRDLFDFAALNTLLKEGAVYVLEEKEMPAEEPLAAIFRY